jgi:hypothetical protein
VGDNVVVRDHAGSPENYRLLYRSPMTSPEFHTLIKIESKKPLGSKFPRGFKFRRLNLIATCRGRVALTLD